MKEDKREEIVFRLYVLNLFLNVIFYFIVDSLNNINAILVFNLLTIGSIELFAKDDIGVGFRIFRGFLAFFFTFIIALVVCAILNALITGIFKEKGERFIESLNIYPADNKTFYFIGSKKKQTEKAEPGPYAQYVIDEKLFWSLTSLQEDDLNKAVENNDLVEAFLATMYSDLMTNRMSCAIMNDLFKNIKEENKDKEIFKQRKIEFETKCPIYEEIYNKYFYMYTDAVKTQKIPIFYYFESKSSESDSNATIGMFPNMSDCIKYNDIFKEKEITLVGKCKTNLK